MHPHGTSAIFFPHLKHSPTRHQRYLLSTTGSIHPHGTSAIFFPHLKQAPTRHQRYLLSTSEAFTHTAPALSSFHV
ncbi:hypothetical protein RRG08_060705 [Elysia crispata]|uniref:Uncharacterized protein n=1 Tax=Elysia crispata TaxID=231223 RepID=A0AAE0ZMS7_9GAST|nr:hypothetical protein RRG08_060705 [Elysia crispata]